MKDLYRRYELIILRSPFFLAPTTLLVPRQFYANLYENVIFWVIVSLGLILLSAYLRIKVWNWEKKNLMSSFAFVVYLVFMFLSVVFSMNFFVSLGFFVLNFSFFLIFTSSGQLLSSNNLRKNVLLMILSVISFLCLISFFNTVIRRYVNYESEGLSYMWIYWGHNHLAALLLIGIPVNAFFIYRYYKFKLARILLGLLLFFLCYSLLISYSRGALLSLLVSFGLAIFFFRRKIGIYFSKGTLVLTLFFLSIIVLSLLHIVSNKSITGIKSRFYHWDRGVSIFMTQPLFGAGVGTYGVVSLEGKPSKSSFAHNSFIQTLAETGLFGAAAFLFILGLVIKRCMEKIVQPVFNERGYLDIVISVSVLALLINELWDFDLLIPSMGLIFWLLVGLLFASED